MGASDPTSETLAEPDPAVLVDQHGRLVAGDRVASEELAGRVLGRLLKRLRRRWPKWAPTHVLYDAVVDVFLDYVDAPQRCDPARASLLGWLVLAAHRDVVNVYRSGRKRFNHDTPPVSALTESGTEHHHGHHGHETTRSQPPPLRGISRPKSGVLTTVLTTTPTAGGGQKRSMADAHEFQADADGRRRYPWPHLKNPVSAVRSRPSAPILDFRGTDYRQVERTTDKNVDNNPVSRCKLC